MDETIDINNTLPFEGGNSSPSIIKVIGVGGGGGNAVIHMYKTGIDRKSTRLNSSHASKSRMPSSA